MMLEMQDAMHQLDPGGHRYPSRCAPRPPPLALAPAARPHRPSRDTCARASVGARSLPLRPPHRPPCGTCSRVARDSRVRVGAPSLARVWHVQPRRAA
eukprot:7153115-Prymnesium_polylepis.1